MSKHQAKISVITITFNAEKYLPTTIQSVLAQTYSNIEYLIIDGQSQDATLSIIKKHESNISRWISEPDKGLYDAMNKGLKLATGDFVIFMNAGDSFYQNDTVEQAFKQVTENVDIVYGETMIINEAGKNLGLRSDITAKKLPKALNWKSLKYGMVVCHQSIFIRTSIAPPLYDRQLSADIDWVINSLKKSRASFNADLVVANYLAGGVSKQQHWTSLKDRLKILLFHFGPVSTFFAPILLGEPLFSN